MKTYFKSAIVMSMLVFLAISCGKDKKKSSNNCDIYTNPYCASQYNQFPGQFMNPMPGHTGINNNAMAVLTNWANEAENRAVGNMLGNQVFVSYTVMRSQKCDKLLGFIPVCTYKNSAPTTESGYVAVPQQGLQRIQYNNISQILYGNITSVQQNGNIIEVIHGQGYQVVRYVIDTNLHAALNPRQEENTITGEVRILTSH